MQKDTLRTIDYKNLPARFPIYQMMALIVFADFYNFPEWAWTIVVIVLVLNFITFLIKAAKYKRYDVFADKNNR